MEVDLSPQGAVGCFNLSTFRAALTLSRSTDQLKRVAADTQNLLMYDEGASSSADPFTKPPIPRTNTINKVAMGAATCFSLAGVKR